MMSLSAPEKKSRGIKARRSHLRLLATNKCRSRIETTTPKFPSMGEKFQQCYGKQKVGWRSGN